ncbi:hypothetical protein A2U01_0108374 [Trifolium medium]|uniref:Uncharacterized protein n=1 Tax=Trifolium medium TaxID=97028 RepID=A0A392VHZ9_9FABA|nr:hypothetical protein [Trifolium medium]
MDKITREIDLQWKRLDKIKLKRLDKITLSIRPSVEAAG